MNEFEKSINWPNKQLFSFLEYKIFIQDSFHNFIFDEFARANFE